MKIKGWLFDVVPVAGGMVVWFIDRDGRMHHYTSLFQPSFYLRLPLEQKDAIVAFVRKSGVQATVSHERKLELFSGEEWAVIKVTVHDPLRLNTCVRSLQKFLPHYAFYNSNIPTAQMFLYENNIFPLAYCEFVLSKENILRQIISEDSFDACDYRVPDLRIMRLQNGEEEFARKFTRTITPVISYEGKTYTIEQQHPEEVVRAFNDHLLHYDPDIIISSWGDATLLPSFVDASIKYKVPLQLNRDGSDTYFLTKEHSYWTYGQVVHRDAAFMLAGRWHLDAENSFIMGESDIEGIIELARLTQIPAQRQSRTSIGTGLASMQMSYAYRNNILIPAEKKVGEDFKTADMLLLSDRGGLVFMPELGYHEQVAELDFASMYPKLMEIHNISPETINCRCCDNHVVPELGYTICEKRRGIVPITLKPVVEKRAYYKAKKRTAASPAEYQKYERRQNALKWMLVTCFGYLGYKNARFGRIEAHESVNAFSREALLTAKEIAEQEGYHLVHAIVDCLWLKKQGATAEDYQRLCDRIAGTVGVDISLEGIYNWILFPNSKIDPGLPTAGKYVGWYDYGDMKVRGIEARRRDTPHYIKTVQKKLLNMLSQAKGVQDVKQSVPALLDEMQFHVDELAAGKVDPQELVLRRRVQKETTEYVNNNLNAMVVKELNEFGITTQPGETIEFIIIDQTGKRDAQKAKSLLTYQLGDGYDREKYTELLLKAVETLLLPFGYDVQRLERHFRIQKGKRKPIYMPSLEV